MFKRLRYLLLCLSILLCGLTGCRKVDTLLPADEEVMIRAAVLYNGASNDGSWEDTYSQLEQSLLLNFGAEAVDVSKDYSLENYDILYPDESIVHSPDAETLKAQITDFTRNGGAVFLTNGFHHFFDVNFIGAKEFVKLTEYPKELELTAAGEDLKELQSIVSDFSALYSSYTDFDRLSQYDYGYAVKTRSAKALVKAGKLALYTMNKYGKGRVFFTNPFLPNEYSINGFSLISRNEKQAALANTTASANQLMLSAFASYVAKQRDGYSISRVFGSNGRPAMAWELHYEEITGIQNGSAILFGDLCKENNQVPSYTIIRNSYWWFLRAESITYLLNKSSGGELTFDLDLNEGAYSSGTHILSGGRWLSLNSIEDAGSYFVDYPDYDQRAYPYAADLSGDGLTDLISGSADGGFYYFEGIGYDGRLAVGPKQTLRDVNGTPIRVAGYSAPVLADINRDGRFDIVSGCADGNIYWFSGNEEMAYHPEGILLKTGITGQTLPEAGDVNDDGIADLIVGSNEGKLHVYYGCPGEMLKYSAGSMKDLSGLCDGLGTFLAPRMTDLDNDGAADLAVGTFDGYIARFIARGGALTFDGYITSTEMNYKGNSNIKFGNNCVPFFYDIDGDGALDLLAGSLEYGLNYPIDSEYFPYHDELQRQIDYMKNNDFYAGAHFYTNAFASESREAFELDAHIKALSSYGLDVIGLGTNQHTWYTSGFDGSQSFLSAYNAGLKWNSGFMPPNSKATPLVSAENVISLPFYLTSGGKPTLLLQNCATLLYTDEAWTDISAKYGMPMCLYYHCDFTYENEAAALADIQKAGAFQNRHNYNFVTEEQLMLGTAAAYNLDLRLSNSAGAKEGSLDILLTPGEYSSDTELYQENYQNACGLRIDFGEAYDIDQIATDADVWYREGNALFVALNRSVRIYETKAEQNEAHIERVNLPAGIQKTENGAVIEFLDHGMLQLAVAGEAFTEADGWNVTRQDGKTIFTKFGKAETVEINF
jgi:hypothetical protein